jgi:hypothetical protein
MEVLDHSFERSWFRNIPIESCARLPEVILRSSATPNLQLLNPVRGFLAEKVERSPRRRLLDRVQKLGNVVNRPLGMHNQVDVVGHEDERPQREFQIRTGSSHGGGKPFARAILGQKREPAKTTERQLVGVAALVY